MVAEWEPAIGVLVAWPLSVPRELLIELAKDTKIYLLASDQKATQDAIQWLTKWKITPDQVKLITAPQGIDAEWTRDWGPHAVFDMNGDMHMADAEYLFATPVMGLSCQDSLSFLYYDDKHHIRMTRTDDLIPDFIAAACDIDMIKLPFAFTGGNVITDGQRSGFSTCALTRENRFKAIPDDQFYRDLNQLLGMDQYHILSNFEQEGIQHIDCFMKMLDEERLLVAQPPVDHPAYPIYERIVKEELMPLKNAYGRPYQILRLDTKPYDGVNLAAYTNSLILNKTVYVPLFSIPQDSIALRQWAEAMPGYTIKGFAFPIKPEKYYRASFLENNTKANRTIGWNSGDALHCRTRAVWNPTMIYMSVDRLPAMVQKAKNYPVRVILKDYSKGSLIPESLLVRWRLKGDQEWKSSPLKPTGVPDQFEAILQGNFSGQTVEYYAEAKSNWGTAATMPAVAPSGFYTFKVN